MSILSTISAYIATKLDLKQDKNSPIDNANKLTTARNIALSGGVTGNVEFDGSSNVTIVSSVADNSHNHTIANVTNLQTTLDSKQNTLVSGINVKTINGSSILGSGNLAIDAGGGVPQNSQVFTASGTFTVPTGVTKVFVRMCAGGGGGGSGYDKDDLGSTATGGASSGFMDFIATVTPGSSYSIVVGAGGAGGAGGSGHNNGGKGGNSTAFGFTTIGADGGLGNSYDYPKTVYLPRAGTNGKDGPLLIRLAGTATYGNDTSWFFVCDRGGAGADGPYGGGGAERTTKGAGNAATNIGAGGGGGKGGTNNTHRYGGAGYSGQVEIYW